MTNAVINVLLAGSAEAIGLDDLWLSFAYYLGMNYLGLMLAQLGEKATQKIQNKCLNFLIPILLYTFFLNPSLIITLLSEGLTAPSFQVVMQPLLSVLSGGIFFKAGEYSTQKIFGKFFPINSAAPDNNNERTYLGYSFGGTPQQPPLDLKKLEEIQFQLVKFKEKIKNKITADAYKLSFENEFSTIEEDIFNLINEISKDQQAINQELYKNKFDTFEKSLIGIQSNLSKLRSGSAKMESLWSEITEILTNLRGIRPIPHVNNKLRTRVLAAYHGRNTIEAEVNVPLITFGNRADRNFNNQYRESKLEGIFSLFKPQPKLNFPEPPTDQELREMGISIYDTPRNNQKIFAARPSC